MLKQINDGVVLNKESKADNGKELEQNRETEDESPIFIIYHLLNIALVAIVQRYE